MAKHWALQAHLFTRNRDHGTWNPRNVETPPPELLEEQVMLMDSPLFEEVLTEELLDNIDNSADAEEGDDDANPKGEEGASSSTSSSSSSSSSSHSSSDQTAF